jgi:Holliday junction resolvasome RuvABC DNA-binding subunit
MMNSKGRKTYETEISELKGKLSEANSNMRMYRTMSESVTKDFLSLLVPKVIPAIKKLLFYRKEYRKAIKNEESRQAS